MDIVVQTSVAIAADKNDVFDIAVASDNLPKFFTGYGPIPGIDKVEIEGGGPLVAGATRYIHNKDGSVIKEELLAVDRGERHQYRLLSGFRAPFSWMIKGALSNWDFDATNGSGSELGTRVTWTFRFHLRSPIAWPFAKPIVALAFSKAMARCLSALQDEAER